MIREFIQAAAVALAILAAAIVGVLVGGLIFGVVSAQEVDDRCAIITLDAEAYVNCVHEEPICLDASSVDRDWFLLASLVDGVVLKSDGMIAFFGAAEGGFTPYGSFAIISMWMFDLPTNTVCEVAVAEYRGAPT